MLRVLIFRLLEPLLVELHDYLGAVGNRMDEPDTNARHMERRRLLEADQHRRFVARRLRKIGLFVAAGSQTLDGPEESVITIKPPVWRSLSRRIRGIGRTKGISPAPVGISVQEPAPGSEQ